MQFFINIKRITKSVDISFQVRLTAYIFDDVKRVRCADVIGMFWITPKLIQTTQIDCNWVSNPLFLIVSSVLASSPCPSMLLWMLQLLKQIIHNPIQNSFPGITFPTLLSYFPFSFRFCFIIVLLLKETTEN